MTRAARYFPGRVVVAFSDILLINAGYLISFWLLWHRLKSPRANFGAYSHLIPVISVAIPVVFQLLDLYGNWLRRSRRNVAFSIVLAVVLISMMTMALGFWARQFAFPRSVILTAMVFQMVLISGWRGALRRLYRRWFGNQRTVVVGHSEENAWEIAEKLQDHSQQFYQVERCIVRESLQAPFPQLENADVIVVADSVAEKNDIILYCFREHKEVLVVPNISELTVYGAESREIDDLLMFGIQPHRLGPGEELLKRVIDIVGAVFLLALGSPVMAVTAVLIRLTSPGPVLFRQERVGRNGTLFHVIKFRTMISDAEKDSGPVLAIDRDPRITTLGRLLRASRIDELPQLFNVIRGQMSLVGPRPEREVFAYEYRKRLPAYELREAVRPGITGLAQVAGRYSTTVERKLRFDLLYIYNYSLLLDFKILLQTVGVVLRQEQASGVSSAMLRKRSYSGSLQPVVGSDDSIAPVESNPAPR